ncbi:MAG: sulfur carrier protein ThiS [Bacteroidia bacterium]|nr:sulfur carrier protein ThiS [Bacteroidia bacterium]
MNLFVNKIPVQTSVQFLGQLMTELGKAQLSGIAVAVNQRVIPRSKWNEYTLQENDMITIISATQGG